MRIQKVLEQKIETAFIGGSGFYELPDVEIVDELQLKTPWGIPSSPITIVKHNNRLVAFLARHGKGHVHIPSQVPFRANLAALKMIGVRQIFAFSAAGSLKKEIEPSHFILPNQIIDRTRHREDTFYNEGITVHISFGDPFSKELADIIEKSMKLLGITYWRDETLLCIEGPAFSTRAESNLYQSWGAGVINMTAIPEAKLSRELEIAYQMVCMSTDYDSWCEDSPVADSSSMLKVLKSNGAMALKLLSKILEFLPSLDNVDLEAHSAIRDFIITPSAYRSKKLIKKYQKLFPTYFT